MPVMRTSEAEKLPWAHEELGAHPERAALEASRLPGARVRDHLQITEHERAQGYVRPLWHTYQHALCGSVQPIRFADAARELARNPGHLAWKGIWCSKCKDAIPIGPDGHAFWVDTRGIVTPVKVGT